MSGDGKSEARAKVLWEGSLKTQSIIRGMEIACDKPKSILGTNTAPAPLEIFISAMGSCLMTTFLYAALKTRIEINDCSVDVRAAAGMEKGRERVQSGEMKLTAWVDESVDTHKVENCFQKAREHCTLTNAVNFPLEFELVIKN